VRDEIAVKQPIETHVVLLDELPDMVRLASESLYNLAGRQSPFVPDHLDPSTNRRIAGRAIFNKAAVRCLATLPRPCPCISLPGGLLFAPSMRYGVDGKPGERWSSRCH
jgi:hypothetical protein